MMIFALICLCICNAFAYPSNEQVTELVQPKSIVGNIVPKPGGVSSDQAPLHSLEPLAIEDEPSDGIKETLEPAASSWGGGGYGRGWGGGGYGRGWGGGWGGGWNRGYGGYGNRGWGGGYGGYGWNGGWGRGGYY